MSLFSFRTFPSPETAFTVARLWRSEAGVEKVFSRIGLVFGHHRSSIQDNLIETLLIITLHGVSNVRRSSQVLNDVDCDFIAGGDSHPPQTWRCDSLWPAQSRNDDMPDFQGELKPAQWREGARELRILVKHPGGTYS
jgi:hypothetical protein